MYAKVPKKNYHTNNRTRCNVADQFGEERLGAQILIVLLKNHLHNKEKRWNILSISINRNKILMQKKKKK